MRRSDRVPGKRSLLGWEATSEALDNVSTSNDARQMLCVQHSANLSTRPLLRD